MVTRVYVKWPPWRLKIKKAKAFQRKSMITLFFREWSDIIILHNKTSSLRNKVQKTHMKQYLNTWKIYIVNVKEENVDNKKLSFYMKN